jgi:hypothetical protein
MRGTTPIWIGQDARTNREQALESVLASFALAWIVLGSCRLCEGPRGLLIGAGELRDGIGAP